MTAALQQAIEAIREAEMLLITAGAGMGVDSGLPDYRGDEGFWNAYPPYRQMGAGYEKMARPSGFRRDAELAWGFYGHCLQLYRRTVPHEGYTILRELAAGMPQGAFVLTSNVDGQFLKAGFEPEVLREAHGSIHRLQCLLPCRREVWAADEVTVEVDMATMRAAPPLPACPFCGGLARPALFAFGDTGYVWEDGEASSARYVAWREKVPAHRLVVVECGAGPVVPGIRREGEAQARRTGEGRLIRINPRDPDVSHPDDISLTMGAAEALRQLKAGLAAARKV